MILLVWDEWDVDECKRVRRVAMVNMITFETFIRAEEIAEGVVVLCYIG